MKGKFHRTKKSTETDDGKENACQAQSGLSPIIVVIIEVMNQLCHDGIAKTYEQNIECRFSFSEAFLNQTCAADGNGGGDRAILIEIMRDNDDCRHVNARKAHSYWYVKKIRCRKVWSYRRRCRCRSELRENLPSMKQRLDLPNRKIPRTWSLLDNRLYSLMRPILARAVEVNSQITRQ